MALPLLLFPGEKNIYAVLPDKSQVFDQAHSIPGLIPLVDASQPPAGEFLAFKAVLDFFTQKAWTVLLQEGALFIPRPAAGAVGHSYPPALYIMG